MKLDILHKIVKEELHKIIKENKPRFNTGDTFMYMGTKHEVISDDGFIVKAKLPNGVIKKLNHNQIK